MDAETDRPPRLAQVWDGSLSWEAFLESYAGTIDAVVRTFVSTYDERMDLFLFVCTALRANGMRRVRSFRQRPDAPCRFTTYLSVVVRNLALDHRRARHGRFRGFTLAAPLDEIDRLVLRYRFDEGRPLRDVSTALASLHGIRLDPVALDERIGRIERALSPSQRWRLLSRWAWNQPAVPIDLVRAVAEDASREIPLRAVDEDPEFELKTGDAARAFERAVNALPARQQLVLALRFRDGLDVAATASTLGISSVQVERATRDALEAIRAELGAARIAREELERALGAWWLQWEANA